MRRCYSALILLICFASFLLVIVGCNVSGRRWVTNEEHLYRDSISVRVELNDTLFAADNMLKYFVVEYDSFPLLPDGDSIINIATIGYSENVSMGMLDYETPTFTIRVLNESSTPFSLPMGDIVPEKGGGMIDSSDFAAEIQYSVGRDGSDESFCGPNHIPHPNFRQYEKGYLRVLFPSVKTVYYGPYSFVGGCVANVVPPDESILSPGRYWLDVAIVNYFVRKSDVPIWTGYVRAPRVFFVVK